MKKLLIAFLLFLPLVVNAEQTVTLIATEPSTNADGTAIGDLAEIVFYYKLEGGNWKECARKPATSPTNGGEVEGNCQITESYDGIVEFAAKAIDDNGNESDFSIVINKPVDNQPPGQPGCRFK